MFMHISDLKKCGAYKSLYPEINFGDLKDVIGLERDYLFPCQINSFGLTSAPLPIYK